MRSENGNDQSVARDNWRRRVRTECRAQDRRDALSLIDEVVEELDDFLSQPSLKDCLHLAGKLRQAADLLDGEGGHAA